MNDELIDKMVDAAQISGLTVDLIEFLINGLEDTAIAILLGNVSNLPAYIKSSDTPNLSRIFSAPSIEILKSPDSHWEYDL